MKEDSKHFLYWEAEEDDSDGIKIAGQEPMLEGRMPGIPPLRRNTFGSRTATLRRARSWGGPWPPSCSAATRFSTWGMTAANPLWCWPAAHPVFLWRRAGR